MSVGVINNIIKQKKITCLSENDKLSSGNCGTGKGDFNSKILITLIHVCSYTKELLTQVN